MADAPQDSRTQVGSNNGDGSQPSSRGLPDDSDSTGENASSSGRSTGSGTTSSQGRGVKASRVMPLPSGPISFGALSTRRLQASGDYSGAGAADVETSISDPRCARRNTSHQDSTPQPESMDLTAAHCIRWGTSPPLLGSPGKPHRGRHCVVTDTCSVTQIAPDTISNYDDMVELYEA